MKVLGAFVHNILKSDYHVNNIVACASARFNLRHKIFLFKDDCTVTTHAFITYVQPLLELRICFMCLVTLPSLAY